MSGAAGTAGRPYGLLIELESATALQEAARRVRDAGYTRWDAYSPFPVHGLEEAMGLRDSRLPWVSLLGGLAGVAAAYLLVWWTNAVDYPYVISDKPLNSVPADIPVMFELTVLFSAFLTLFAILAFTRLPRWRHPVFSSRRFKRATTDRFFICIETSDPRFDERGTTAFLAALGGGTVERLED